MIKFLNKINKDKLKGVALLRLDFNTEDFWRIDLILPTIIFLKKYANKIIIISHKGRPNNFNSKLSLEPQVKYLEKKLKTKIKFINHFNFKNIKNTIRKSEQKIFVLENIRFLKEEYNCSQQLASKLAQLGNYFVNDAFAVCHRCQTSVTELPKFLPSYAGLQLEKEIKILGKNIKKPTKPLILIIGGAKAKDKIGVIKNFINKAKYILLGGGSGNTMLFLKNINVYDSLREKDEKILNDFKKLLKYKNIILPIDYKINQNQILDLGPQTIKLFKEKIKIAKTIIWSGPLGMIEDKRHIQGSLEIAKSIILNSKANSIVGGGETVMFLKKHNLDKKIKFISTGGGAMLEFLAGKKLPGIEILKNAKKIRKRI
ncbi:MAG: phosphoglycerate kinase [Patescibacteria group bacterium]|nr:phosphoglycerate kinase [Patescibacteria group bacterium]